LVRAQRASPDERARCDDVRRAWRTRLNAVEVSTPDRGFDLMINTWLPYQCLAARLYARAGFYPVSGAVGCRAQLQDTLALLLHDAQLARAQILNAAGRQFRTGDVQHWWLPASGAGVRTTISDDIVWLVYAAATYAETTGDTAIFDEMVPFLAGPPLEPGAHSVFFTPTASAGSASLFEHCALALDLAMRRTGTHGLPLMLGGDWNDGIDRFALRTGDILSFELTRSRTGYAISARGKSFDMRGLLKNLREQSDGGNPADLTVEARVERLIGFNNEEIRDASISMVSANGVTRKLEFSGKIGDGEIAASYADNGSAASMSIESPEGGRVMRFADLYSHVSSGNLRVQGKRQDATGRLLGTLELTNFAIVDESAMKSVVSESSSPGGGRSGLDSNNVRFDRLVINFAQTDQAITVSEALLGGPAIGATFNGRFDLASSTVSINGTYLPAYQFNNLFGRLPIIGLALGGGSREGLFGVTFKIEGPTTAPRVFINPLSAVAPGIFRKIFEFQ
jgi:hypothetical protein